MLGYKNMGEVGCLKDGNFQNLQVAGMFRTSSETHTHTNIGNQTTTGTFTSKGAVSLGTTEPMSAGAGITTGVGTVIKYGVVRVGKIFTTQIYIDLTGLSSSAGVGDLIGKTGTTGVSIGKITTAVNGTIVAGTVTCLEVALGGDPDVDIWTATDNVGVQDASVTTLTGQIQQTNNGDYTLGMVGAFMSTVVPAPNSYLYLSHGTGGHVGAYTAGKLLITLYGTA